YIEKEIQEKNIASKNTIDFINKKLTDMKDSLALIEMAIQDYKNQHEITDISIKVGSFYEKLSQLEKECTKYKLKEQYYNYLSSTIKEKQNLEKLITPSVYGIEDVTLNELASQLISFQIQKEVIKEEGQVKNPAVARFASNINQLILKIEETVRNNSAVNKSLIEDVNLRIKLIESSLNKLPKEERELLSIQRMHDISEQMYMFLLQKRAEAGITESSNVADSKVIEPAIFHHKQPLFPKKSRNYLIALLCSLLFPLILLFLV
ncbi:uncharacterized protein METZ01_LOCUS436035, partial [marine metagenome]